MTAPEIEPANDKPTKTCMSTKRKMEPDDYQEDDPFSCKKPLLEDLRKKKASMVECEVVYSTDTERLASKDPAVPTVDQQLIPPTDSPKTLYSTLCTNLHDSDGCTSDVQKPEASDDLSDTASVVSEDPGNETVEVEDGDQELIMATDWSKIPFPPFYGDQQELVEESGEKSAFHKVEVDIRVTDEELKDLCYGLEDKLYITRRCPKSLSRAFDKLPLETWMDIMDIVDNKADLLHLSMVNSFFYKVAIPRLYQRINIRSPYNRRDSTPQYRAVQARHKIPLNLLLKGLGLPDYPDHLAPWKMLKYAQELTIDHWDSPWDARKRDLLFPINPHTTVYDVWKGYDYNEPSPQMIQLFLGNPDSPLPLVSLNAELATLISTQMPNLRSFSFKPEPGYIEVFRTGPTAYPYTFANMLNVPTLTSDILDALKALPKLRNLYIDFTHHDPLALNRMNTSRGYNRSRHGLVGFKNLEKLDIIMVDQDYRQRIRELSRVICDCICSGHLKEIRIIINNDYRNTLHQKYSTMKPLCETIWKSLFADTIRKAQIDPDAVPLLSLDVLITCTFLSCNFRTSGYADVKSAYNLNWQNLIYLHDRSASTLPNTLIQSKDLTRIQPQNLQRLHLRCSIAKLGPLLKATHGLRRLIIIAPASPERVQLEDKHRNNLHIRHAAAYKVTNTITHPKGHIRKMNRILDYLVKYHLLHLEVLVIDELIPCPKSFPFPTWNSLSSWKSRAHNVREVGLHLWGPWEQIEEFMGVFTVAKYLHLFNALNPNQGMYVKGMPEDIQITSLECMQRTPWWCNAAMVACRIGRKLAAGITGEDSGCRVSEENWIGTGNGKSLGCDAGVIGPMRSKNGSKGLRAVDNYGPTPPGTTGLNLFRPSYSKPADISRIDPPSIRWLAVGPWHINAQFNWRWKWDEDEAGDYLKYWKKLEFYGEAPGWFGMGAFGRREKPWKEGKRSVMWDAFEGYVKR